MQKEHIALVAACKATHCKAPAMTQGYCSRHYQQIRRHGRLTPEREYQKRARDGKMCAACACLAVARGYCTRHYQQMRRHGRLTPERERQYGRQNCRVTGCDKRHSARGFCQYHYVSEYYRPVRQNS